MVWALHIAAMFGHHDALYSLTFLGQLHSSSSALET